MPLSKINSVLLINKMIFKFCIIIVTIFIFKIMITIFIIVILFHCKMFEKKTANLLQISVNGLSPYAFKFVQCSIER